MRNRTFLDNRRRLGPAYGVPALAGRVSPLKVARNIPGIQCRVAFYRLKPGLHTRNRRSAMKYPGLASFTRAQPQAGAAGFLRDLSWRGCAPRPRANNSLRTPPAETTLGRIAP